MKITPVILVGGSGTRLWPLSRKHYPKQFLSLFGEQTLFQQTLLRLKGLDINSPIVICNEKNRFFVAEQAQELGMEVRIILEPMGKNTAPAIAIAAFHSDPKDILLVLPADHVIQDRTYFAEVVNTSIGLALQNYLVTFGIQPSFPHTGYGYIQCGEKIGTVESFQLKQFVEKPELEVAQRYLDSGGYLWNSGMFMFAAKVYLDELKANNEDMFKACLASYDSITEDLDFYRIDSKTFEKCPSDSIDYAVMEHTATAAVVPFHSGWSDVGSWSSVWELVEKDENQNGFVGDVLSENSSGNYVYSEDRLIALIGMNDCVVIDTKDAVLVAKQNETQKVKDIVNTLSKAKNRSEHEFHREVYRPWGKYDSIDNGERYQVKRITVKPGQKLSVQKHFHRAEHWIVVSGTAEVQNGDRTFLLSENESTFIPVGVVHSLSNPGKVPLELIEVQTGSYLGEDDIVRYNDIYGRA